MSDWSDIQTALDADEIVLLPTETVYGLAALANNPTAISRVYAIKGREFDKPLAVCVRDIAQARKIAEFDKTSLALAEKYWPGPLTLVLNLSVRAALDPRVTSNMSGQATIAIRCPDIKWRQYLDHPLALTSANRSGAPDCVDYETAMSELGNDVAASLPASGPLSGAPSTIVRCHDGNLTVLRQGALEVEL